MKFATKLATLAISGLILVAACKKKEDPVTTVPKTKKEYLQEGKWQVTSMPMEYSFGGFGSQTWNQYDSMDACEKDNFVRFLTTGKILTDEGATKCSSSDPQVDSTSNWVLSDDYTKLSMPMDGVPSGAATYEVQELTATSLKLYNKYDTSYNASGIPITISSKTTIVFKAIQ